MTAYALIMASTTRRLLKLRRMAGLIVLTGLPAPILFFVSFGTERPSMAGLYDTLLISVFSVIALPITAMVLSTAAFGEERRLRTMPFLIVKPVNRWVIAGAVTTAAVIATVVVGGIGVIGSWLVGAVVADKPLIGLPALVSVVVAAGGYAALFVPLGLLVSRATLAGLAYIFIWESIIGSIASGVSASSMWRTGLSAYGDIGTISRDGREVLEGFLSTVVVGVGGAFAKIAVLLAISVAITGTMLRRRDLAEE
jgi:ABC-2 type transport system permease protein